jgi:hypothetical protein
MLEIADKGFDKLSREIDEYARTVRERATAGDYDIELNSVSLEQFLRSWAEENRIPFQSAPDQESDRVIIQELKDFGINTLGELREIIPPRFPDAARTVGYTPNTLSLVRDWMMIHDLERYRDRAWKENWVIWEDHSLDPDRALYILLLGKDRAEQLIKMFAYVES